MEKQQSVHHSANFWRGGVIKLVVDIALPIGLYFALHFMGISDLMAFALPAAIPVLRATLWWIWKRKIEWIAVFASLGFALELLGTFLLNGNPLFFKAHDVLLTGPLGVTLLVSALIGKPLFPFILQLIQSEKHMDTRTYKTLANNPITRSKAMLLTIGIGILLTVHAVIELSLALVLPSSTFLLVSKVVGWSVIIIGLLLLSWLLRVESRRQHV